MNEKLNIYSEKESPAVDIQSTIDSGLSTLDSSEKVSEIVNESASEDIGNQTKPKNSQKTKKVIKNVQKIFRKSKQTLDTPSISVQRDQVKDFLQKSIQKLSQQAKKASNPYNFSATSLEKILIKIRYQRQLIRQLAYKGKAFIEGLYKRYITTLSI